MMQSLPEPPMAPRDDKRASAKRTALALALVAGGIYLAFILSGVIGR
jgi:hypothetical protein